MRRPLIYLIFACVLFASCSKTETHNMTSDDFEMRFRAVVDGSTRVTGIYDDTVYPVGTPLYLTAWHTDDTNHSQYYFIDKILDYDSGDHLWKAPSWLWPMQGKMAFMSYWCPGFGGAPTFDYVDYADGTSMPRMNVDASALDGMTDFIYLAQTDVDCPKSSPITLTYKHGLAWLTLRVRAQVLNEDNTPNTAKSADLAKRIYIRKVTIEDCARKGFATVVPTSDPTTQNILWQTFNPTTEISYVRDQVYYKFEGGSASDQSHYKWEELADGSQLNVTQMMPLSTAPRILGDYSSSVDAPFVGNGLLIIPQDKTSITVDYTVYDLQGSTLLEKFQKTERFVLRDNSVSWLPGMHYTYDIVFRNYDDIHSNFDIIETWKGIGIADGATGSLDGGDNQVIICPIHHGGSGLGDDMDYPEGPTVF